MPLAPGSSPGPSAAFAGGDRITAEAGGPGRGARSPWLDNLRIVAAAAVVVLHVSGYAFRDLSRGLDSGWWAGNVFNSASRWSVPVFIMISGALILGRDAAGARESAPAFYRRRAGRILAPWVFWTAVYALLAAFGGRRTRSLGVIAAAALREGQTWYHLWFLPLIAGLYVLTPLLRRALAALSLRARVALCALLFAAALHVPSFLLGGTGVQALINPEGRGAWPLYGLAYAGYFVMGGLAAAGGGGAGPLVPAAAVALGLSVTTLGTGALVARFGTSIEAHALQHNLSLPVILTSWGIFSLARAFPDRRLLGRWNTALADTLLGVFLVHPLCIELVWRWGPGLNVAHPALGIPLVSAVVFGLSLLITLGLRRIPVLRRVV